MCTHDVRIPSAYPHGKVSAVVRSPRRSPDAAWRVARTPRLRRARAKPHGRDRPLPDGPPLVTPGEHMTLSAHAAGRRARDVRARGRRASARSRASRRSSCRRHAKAVGLAAMRRRQRRRHVHVVDRRRDRPAAALVLPTSTRRRRPTRSTPRPSSPSAPATRCRSTFHLNDDAPKPEPQTVSLADTWDYNAFSSRCALGSARAARRSPPRCCAAATCGTST